MTLDFWAAVVFALLSFEVGRIAYTAFPPFLDALPLPYIALLLLAVVYWLTALWRVLDRTRRFLVKHLRWMP